MATFWEKATHSVGHVFSLYLVYLFIFLFPVLALGQGLVLIAPVPVHCIVVTFMTGSGD